MMQVCGVCGFGSRKLLSLPFSRGFLEYVVLSYMACKKIEEHETCLQERWFQGVPRHINKNGNKSNGNNAGSVNANCIEEEVEVEVEEV